MKYCSISVLSQLLWENYIMKVKCLVMSANLIIFALTCKVNSRIII